MISFRISAPGKMILFGEHAVVYGKTAVAVSLGCRSSVTLSELSTLEESFLYVEMSNLKLSVQIPINWIQTSLLQSASQELNNDSHDEHLLCIQKFIETLGLSSSAQKTSIECLLYALVQVARAENLEMKSCRLIIDSELIIGAGLGSSASFSVCLVAGFLHWSQCQNNSSASSVFDTKSLENISRYAYNCEKIMHGSPSGIDNFICTFGSIIKFQKDKPPRFISPNLKKMRVLLVNTLQGRSTKMMVNNVAALMNKYPEIFCNILEAIDALSKRAVDIFEQMHNLSNDEKDSLLEIYRDLAVLIDVNQGLLAACRVSHPCLDLICITAKKYGFSAKLTGAGGGGFAYILIPPNALDVDIQHLSSDLIKNGFSIVETDLGGPGVKIHHDISELIK